MSDLAKLYSPKVPYSVYETTVYLSKSLFISIMLKDILNCSFYRSILKLSIIIVETYFMYSNGDQKT